MINTIQILFDAEARWYSRYEPATITRNIPVWKRQDETYYSPMLSHQWFHQKMLEETFSFQQWIKKHSFDSIPISCVRVPFSSLINYFSQDRTNRIMSFVKNDHLNVLIIKWGMKFYPEIVQVYVNEKEHPQFGVLLDEINQGNADCSLWCTYQAMLHLNYQWINRQEIHVMSQQDWVPFFEIPYYFPFPQKLCIPDNDFFLKEGLSSGWFSMKNNALQMGLLRFSLGSSHREKELLHFDLQKGDYQLMMSPESPLICEEKNDYVLSVSYDEFLNYLHKIPEFREEDPHLELAMIAAMGGHFFLLMNHKTPIASFCVERVGENFDYISYVSIVPEFRKSMVSNTLMQAIQYYSFGAKKRNLVAVITPAIVHYYQKAGYQTVGYWSL
jgi:hypothetical protein